MAQKTIKIADIQSFHAFDLVVILDRTAQQNPLKVYKKWFDAGWHRKKINEFSDMVTAMRYMTGIIQGQIKV